MSFRRFFLLSLTSGMVAIFGCGLKTGEKSPDKNPPSFSGKGYSCVGQIPQHLERYAADELNESEITDFVRCLQRAFTSFAQLTRGRDQQVYAPEEIRRFLEAYFLKERPISDQLLHEFMVVKQVFVGGEIDKITRPELAELIEFLEDVRREAIRLKPHLKFLNPRLIVHENPKEVGVRLKEANETLKTSIRVLSLRLQKGKREYPLENFETLIDEFRTFVRWDEHFKDAKPTRNWINFIRVFKTALVTPDEPNMMRPQDWAPFLQTLSRWYLAFIEYQVGIKNQPKLYGVGLQNTVHLGQEIIEMLEEAIHRQPEKSLSQSQIAALIVVAQDLAWLPANLRAESVDRVVYALINRVFTDGSPGVHSGLTLPALMLMKYEFYRWTYIQMQLNARFKSQTEQKESARPIVPNLQVNILIPPDVRAKLRGLRDADWENFLKVRELMRPLFNDNLSRVTIVPEADLEKHHVTHDFNNLSVMNLLRSAVSLLFRGYASEYNNKDWTGAIKSEEMQAFYEDVRDMAVDLGLADRRVFNTGSRAFIEGNLFTYAADGLSYDLSKSRLSYVETIQLLAFLYSGGRTASDWYTQLKVQCPLGPLDQNGDSMIDRPCVTKTMGDLIVNFAVNMPGLNEYMRTAPNNERDQLVRNLIDAAFSPKNSKVEWVERNELSIMAVVLHYLEAVLTRFDTDRDGMVTNREIRRAIPIFTGFIKRFARDRMDADLSDVQAQGVFLYILAYRTVPTKWNILRVYRLSPNLSWEWEFQLPWETEPRKVSLNLNQEINLNRSELSTVFRVIVAKLFDTAPVAEKAKLMGKEGAARSTCGPTRAGYSPGCL